MSDDVPTPYLRLHDSTMACERCVRAALGLSLGVQAKVMAVAVVLAARGVRVHIKAMLYGANEGWRCGLVPCRQAVPSVAAMRCWVDVQCRSTASWGKSACTKGNMMANALCARRKSVWSERWTSCLQCALVLQHCRHHACACLVQSSCTPGAECCRGARHHLVGCSGDRQRSETHGDYPVPRVRSGAKEWEY
jgi:hypothetical protein